MHMMDTPCSGQTSHITESLCFVLLHSLLPLCTPPPPPPAPGSLRCAFLIQINQSRAHTPSTSFIGLSLDHNPAILLMTPGPVSDSQRQCCVPEPTVKVLAQVSSWWTSVLPGLPSPPAAHPGTGCSLFLGTVSNKLCLQWKCFRICCPYYALDFLLICYILKQPCSSFFL